MYSIRRRTRISSMNQAHALQIAAYPLAASTTNPTHFDVRRTQFIGFWSDEQLKKVPVTGGVAVTLADVPANSLGASWGADDVILYAQPEGIMQVPGVGGIPSLLVPAEGETLHAPQMLPGGEYVLFTVGGGLGALEESQVVAQSVTTGERTVLINEGLDGWYVPTGHLIYGSNGRRTFGAR